MANIRKLPSSVRALPSVEARVDALQRAVNAELHSRNICPVSQSMAGPRGSTVGVFRNRRGGYYLDVQFNSNREGEDERLVQIGHWAIEAMS